MWLWVQFIFAAPLFAAGVGCMVYALRNPGSIGMVRLALFSFALQFCLGPTLAVFRPNESDWAATEIVIAWVTIYFFWLAVALTSLVWQSRLDPVLIARDRAISSEKGVFAALMDASLAVNPFTALFFYAIVTGVRTMMFVVYGVGLSGTSTLELITGLPYHILVLHKTFYALGLAFVFLAMVNILYRRPGWYLFLFVILAEILFAFTQGRRRVFAVAVLMMFGFLIKHGRIKGSHAVLGLIGAAILWQWIFPFFVAMRHQWQDNPYSSVASWVQGAIEETVTGGAYGERRLQYAKSVKDRLEALSFNYTVARQMTNGYQPLGGVIIKNALVTMVPRVLFPGKLDIVYGDDELVAHHFGIPEADFYSNFPAFSMADLGVVGGLIYGFVFGLAIRSFELMMKILLRRGSIGVFAVFSVVCSNMVLQMEFPPASFANDTRLIAGLFVMFFILSTLLGGGRHERNPFEFTGSGPYDMPETPYDLPGTYQKY